MIKSEYIKKHYDKELKNIDYESYRWRKDKASEEQYEETKKAILFHLISAKDVLEIGPGPGTWTKFLMKKAKKIFLVDISKEMLKQAKKNLGNKVKYGCLDFLDFKTNRKFDLIFSSRVIEYIPDIEKTIKKIKSLLKKNGKIIIITKNPARRWKHILFKNKLDKLHENWIPISKIKKIMQNENFKEIRIYPIIFSTLPFPNFVLVRKLNNLMHKLFYKKQLFAFLIPFIESYLIKASI